MTHSFQSPRYSAIGYTIENLALDNGETFSGELSIEPEGRSSEDWYIYRACADDPEDENKIVYFDATRNAATFAAICRAVCGKVELVMAIGDEARE